MAFEGTNCMVRWVGGKLCRVAECLMYILLSKDEEGHGRRHGQLDTSLLAQTNCCKIRDE